MITYRTRLYDSHDGSATTCVVFAYGENGCAIGEGETRAFRTYPRRVRARDAGDALAKRHAAGREHRIIHE